jgi:N-glycosylase/DNA lyase
MVSALVEHLGPRASGAPAEGWGGRAFPSPEAVASADDDFFKDVAKTGYRGPYLRAVAEATATGTIDIESWGSAARSELPDDELEADLLALPGVGPYAAAHIMMMLGRYSRLILDSWTRPTYARIVGKKKVADATIVRRFKRYGPYAGLAFWLVLTRSWVPTEDEG